MTEKRFEVDRFIEGFPVAVDVIDSYAKELFEQGRDFADVTIDIHDNYRKQINGCGKNMTLKECCELLNTLHEENEQLKQQIKDMSRFEHTGEHIRLSINVETGELQRHIYATGQWFGDFDRVLVTNWLDEKTYQKFIDRVIEVYNTEFKGE